MSRVNGGIFEAERQLGLALQQLPGMDLQIVGLRDKYTDADSVQWQPLCPRTYPVTGPAAFGYSAGLFKDLMRSRADLIISAGLWKYPAFAAGRWAQLAGKPLMVTPHGMLEAWALQNSRLKKRLVGWLFQNNQLRQARCIRALCLAEARSIRAYGLKNPIAVIPNGIDVPQLKTQNSKLNAPWRDFVAPGTKVLLFLSRIHPKKGLVNLLRAWSELMRTQMGSAQASSWVLAIAGPDEGGHEAELQQLCREHQVAFTDIRQPESNLPLGASVIFLGPQFKSARARCYAAADAFVLPSFSEGFSMAILEAAAARLPVLLTPECNFPELVTAGGAVEVPPTLAGCRTGLHQIFSQSETVRQDMGERGHALIANNYTWAKIASQMQEACQWLIAGGSKPEFVM